MNWQRTQAKLGRLVQWSFATWHHRVLTLGGLVVLWFLPTWAGSIWYVSQQGTGVAVINLGLVYWAIDTLWKKRKPLSELQAYEDEKIMGYSLILISAVLFFGLRSSISFQYAAVVLILAGMAWSVWGTQFFLRYWFIAIGLMAGLYPNWVFVSNTLWHLFTPPYFLENFMAQMGKFGLQLIGFTAVVEGRFISLPPKGAVEVAMGCNGFDMAFSLAGASLVMGLLLRLSWRHITSIILLGIVLALMFNVPRIMLLTIASVLWGKQSFEFWHGPIGGQLFAGTLFTIYYYVVMWTVDRKPAKT